MTGPSTVLANGWLNLLRSVAYTPPAGTFIQMHVGDPGAAGTANPSAVTGRQPATFAASTTGVLALSNTPTFTAASTETITHISVWDTVTAGVFLWSALLGTPKPVVATDTVTFSTVSLTVPPA